MPPNHVTKAKNLDSDLNNRHWSRGGDKLSYMLLVSFNLDVVVIVTEVSMKIIYVC